MSQKSLNDNLVVLHSDYWNFSNYMIVTTSKLFLILVIVCLVDNIAPIL